MVPHYTISEEIGRGGPVLNVSIDWFQQVGGRHNFNPFRDINYGGTTIYWRGKNRYIPDHTFIGYFLKKIYGN